MKIIPKPGKGFDIEGLPAVADFDFIDVARDPRVIAAADLCAQWLDHAFVINRPSGRSRDGRDVPMAVYRVLDIPDYHPFCRAIKETSPAAFQHCGNHISRYSSASYQTGNAQTGECRFGGMSCVSCGTVSVDGTPAAQVGLLGARRATDTPPPFDDIARQLRREDPGIELESIRQAHEQSRAIRPELLLAMRDLMIEVTREAARDAVERRRQPAAPAAAVTETGDSFFLIPGSLQETILFQLLQFRDHRLPIVIQGESGSGKELLARRVHQSGRRGRRPFVAVPCAVLSPQLVEAELFGYVRGAFSGALKDFKGFFERADGGTLFFDEIAEFPLDVQTRLLRVIETGEVRRIGAESSRRVDVRIMAASTRDLAELARQGRLLKPLFYRIQGLSVTLPPLREKPDDIPHFAENILQERNFRQRKHQRFAAATLDLLRKYPWPGNLRELRNAVDHAAALAATTIMTRHLPADVARHAPVAAGTPTDGQSLDAVEKRHIELVLHQCAGNMSRAANVLKIKRNTLYAKCRRYGIALR